MARLDDRAYEGRPEYPEAASTDDPAWRAWLKADKEFWEKLEDAQHNSPEDEVVGTLITFVVGDAVSTLICTKRRPLTLQQVDGPPVPEHYVRGVNIEFILDRKKKDRSYRLAFGRPARRQPLIPLPKVPQ